MHIAAAETHHDLIPALQTLRNALNDKAKASRTSSRSGAPTSWTPRPLTLGQEFGGYAHMVDNAIRRVEAPCPRFMSWPRAARRWARAEHQDRLR